jgi:hypothetical protein
MIVPQYWAEARIREIIHERQVTVRRFGWSDLSVEDAQRHAEARAREAMNRIESGEPLPRREPKVPYNGAEGVPIREEIVARHGDVIIMDIDFPQGPSARGCFLLFLAPLVLALGFGSYFGEFLASFAMVYALWFLGALLSTFM